MLIQDQPKDVPDVLMEDIDKIIETASIDEKLSLLSGKDFWHTAPIPRFNVRSIRCSDGPNGVRGSRFFNSVPAVCLPCGTGLGATWNKELLYTAGVLLSDECTAKGAHVWLGPTVNIQRSPLNGRGFEGYSEDPHLSGMLAASIINGVQSGGTMATLKHFAANDQETAKMFIDVRISDRALREIHLMPFQLALKHAKPEAVMSSYNKLQGEYCSESTKLLKNILRDEWGFKGLIMSDWYGTYSTEGALLAGVDLEMPGKTRFRSIPALLESVASGKLQKQTLDNSARSVLKFVKKASMKTVAKEESTRDVIQDRLLNRQLAYESIVLLKNEENILPLQPDCGDIAIIGPNAKFAAACGGGSASLRPYYTSSAFEGISSHISPQTTVHYEVGAYGHILLPIFHRGNVINESEIPGATIEFFHEPCTDQNRLAFDKVDIHETAFQLMDYNHSAVREVFYISMRAFFVPEQTGIYEFGLASYGTSNLYINDQLVIDNSTVQSSGGMFFGKGSTEVRATFPMERGVRYCLRVEGGSAATSKVNGGSKIPLPGGACRLGGCLQIDPRESIQRAVELAKKCKYTIVVAGLSGDYEKEGQDRKSMDLPPGVDDLISAVLAARPNAIIVTQAGSPVTMPWASKAKAILHSWYGGNESGNGLADVLFGTVNPSGKLPISFPKKLQDNPTFLYFGNDNGSVHYAEDIFVGYRYYESKQIDVQFPFGHGLSYTTFNLSKLVVSPTVAAVLIKNTGERAGAEVLQLFIASSDPYSSRFKRPARELKGFEKVFLEPGEEKTVNISLDKYSVACWDEIKGAWVCERGSYTISIVAGKGSLEAKLILEEDIYWTGL